MVTHLILMKAFSWADPLVCLDLQDYLVYLALKSLEKHKDFRDQMILLEKDLVIQILHVISCLETSLTDVSRSMLHQLCA